MNESCGDRANPKSECNPRKPPTRSYPLAHDIRRDLKDDIGDEENGEHSIIIIIDKSQIFVEARKLGISYFKSQSVIGQAVNAMPGLGNDERTYIGTIDETEQIHHGDGWNNVKVDLESQFGLCYLIELNQGLTIFICREVAPLGRFMGNFPHHMLFML